MLPLIYQQFHFEIFSLKLVVSILFFNPVTKSFEIANRVLITLTILLFCKKISNANCHHNIFLWNKLKPTNSETHYVTCI
jgi:hypothetical protein